MINYFLLAYQGFDYFREKFDKKKYPNTILRIIDNGNQKINGHQLYETKKNIGCAGGWNLICYIAFEYLGLEKIIIGQEDAIVEENEMKDMLEKCNENTISTLIKPHFEFSTFALHKKTFTKIGMFDENCIDAYCEDADYKQRCYLNKVKIESLNKSPERNFGISRKINKRIYDTITVNRIYIREKWGKSINKNKIALMDEQPPYEFKKPFNKNNLDSNFIPITERMRKIQDLKDNKIPSQEEILKFLINPEGIKK
tara:strand:- start:1189 stop:1956 length:768 start_codon:yes stop_codon:yes gene_type:complete